MKIFLAGKVGLDDGAWRSAIIGNCNTKVEEKWVYHPGWQNVRSSSQIGGQNPWVSRVRSIFGLHDYVGPFRQMFVNADGAMEVYGDCQHGCPCIEPDTDMIFANCIEALERADMVFALINRADAYGTIAELAMAWLQGKFVSVLIHPTAGFNDDDFWYVRKMAHHIGHWPSRTDRHKTEDDDGFPAVTTRYATDAKAAVEGLRDALIAYTGWVERNPPPQPAIMVVQPNRTAEMARSFRQIAQWTSDPRVRDEASKMLRQLGG